VGVRSPFLWATLAPLALVAALAGCTSRLPGASTTRYSSPPIIKVSLNTSFTTSTGVVAVVAMGTLSDPLNTFWQVFVRPNTTGRWTLVTPPGVADNGGLVASGSPAGGSLLVGFEPSQDLEFSPLALTANDGTSWSTGLVPGPLAAVPDALALSSGAGSLALVRSQGGEVLRSTGGPTDWSKVVSRVALASSRAGMSCGVGGITAVALNATGGPLVGTTCTSRGVVGIFGTAPGGWSLVGPRLTGPAGSASTKVVRLVDADGVASALVALAERSTTSLVGVARINGGSWSHSVPLIMYPGAQVLSTGVESGGGFVILAARPHRSPVLDMESGPGGGWHSLSPPPRGTAAVAVEPGGVIAALVVDSTLFTEWRLGATAHTWSKIGSVRVPIQFGSSS
jgi:hypothetical protein